MKRLKEVFETSIEIGVSTNRPYLKEGKETDLAIYLKDPEWKAGDRVRVTVQRIPRRRRRSRR